MTEQEWAKRYQRRFIERAGLTAEEAAEQCEATSFQELSEGFEDDPEGAADSEMSYWTD